MRSVLGLMFAGSSGLGAMGFSLSGRLFDAHAVPGFMQVFPRFVPPAGGNVRCSTEIMLSAV